MSDEFTDAYAKLARADAGLVELRELLRTHLSGEGVIRGQVEYVPGEQPDLRTSIHIERFSADAAVVIGEIAHNLRAALDHTVWRLVLLAGGTPKKGRRGTTFPIFEAPPEHLTVAGGVSAAALVIIEAAQPHNDPRLVKPLAVLAHVSNTDKHRGPVPGRHGLGSWATWHDGDGTALRPWTAPIEVLDGDEHSVHLRFVADPASGDGGGMAIYQPEIETSAAGGTFAPLLSTLREVARSVRDLVDDLVATTPQLAGEAAPLP